jgi:hypothetical protein
MADGGGIDQGLILSPAEVKGLIGRGVLWGLRRRGNERNLIRAESVRLVRLTVRLRCKS